MYQAGMYLPFALEGTYIQCHMNIFIKKSVEKQSLYVLKKYGEVGGPFENCVLATVLTGILWSYNKCVQHYFSGEETKGRQHE